MARRWLNFWHSLSGVGLPLGILCFAAALTPTLVPRTPLTQGLVCGVCFATGYAAGALFGVLWNYLELPNPAQRGLRIVGLAILIGCTALAIFSLLRAAAWQNSIRSVMGLDPVTSAHPFRICAIALATFLVLIVLTRGFRSALICASNFIHRVVPRRISNVVGTVVVVLVFWSLVSNVLLRAIMHTLDSSYREYDALLEPESLGPTSLGKTGSTSSLISWDKLGRAGRGFLASAPSAKDISALTGRKALDPIRVYVGLRAASTLQERAKLALQELKRADAFTRSVLVVVTPTGTGWIDPAAIDAIEYLHHGNTASVALQYSYLSSPLSSIAQPEYGADAARALFSEVYGYWTRLPKDKRPKIYLHGLSLGALNSEQSAQLFEMIEDPINGALWSGPPFESGIWRSVTDRRNAGSPAWLPEFRDGSFIRFINQGGARSIGNWGPMRIVYLQYGSDPVTFFDYRYFYRRPDWMAAVRAPDVSADMRWYPAVTWWQLTLDLAVATSTPVGYGHVYAPQHYIDAWIEVSDVHDWSYSDIDRLKHHLAMKEAVAPSEDRGG